MADKKISELPSKNTPTANDLLPIVDTAASPFVSKKTTFANFVTAFGLLKFSDIGVAGGAASLDITGKVPFAQLPVGEIGPQGPQGPQGIQGPPGEMAVYALTYAPTVNTNVNNGDIFDITLTGNVVLANPTNPVNGKTIRWRLLQDSVGGRTIALGNKFVVPSSASTLLRDNFSNEQLTDLPFSTTPNTMDILAATYHAGRDKWDVVSFAAGY